MTVPAYDPRQPFGVGNGVEVRDNLPRFAPCTCDILLRECPSCIAAQDWLDAHTDPDGENAQRRAEVATIRAETRARGGHVELAR